MEKNMAKLTIEVYAEDVEKAMQSAYQKAKGRISIPGFRKGKAPRKMIEQMYGKGVFLEDAVNALIPEHYSKALGECELEIVSQPKIDLVQTEPGKALIFTAEVAVKPEVTLGEYKGVEVPKSEIEVTDEEVDAEVKKYNAIFEKKVVEVEDEEFSGCEIKTVGAKAVLDLGLAVFEKDVYINFNSTASTLTIILPEGVNVACDIEKSVSSVKNLVDNVDEEGIHTVYVIGKAVGSSIEIIPVNFYMDDDDDFEDADEDIFVDEDKQEAAAEKEALQPSEDGEADDKLDIEEVE